MLKRHRSSVKSTLLPHDVIELILERLAVKSLLSFKSVSKLWKSTIESRRFQQAQLIRRMQSRGPDLLFIYNYSIEIQLNRVVFGSSIISKARFPSSCFMVCHGSCDGLVCFTSLYASSYVINPATRWHRCFPMASIQQVINNRYMKKEFDTPSPKLGFGKDKFMGTYKAVWLYNSFEFGLGNVTTCQVFDFSTNATWKHLVPASPLRIFTYHQPVYFDGSLHWFTECEETKVLSFDLHTGTFQVITKTPFAHVHEPRCVVMCVLNNRLCVSEKNWPNQVIWSFDSSGGNKTWKKMCSIDLTKTVTCFEEPAILPIAIMEEKKLIIYGHGYSQLIVPVEIHDLRTNTYDVLFNPTKTGSCVHYFESLLSI